MKKQLSIGSVIFWKDGKPFDELVGDERVKALRAFFRGEPLNGLEPRADMYNHNRRLTWADVAWQTAGKRVTDPASVQEMLKSVEHDIPFMEHELTFGYGTEEELNAAYDRAQMLRELLG